MTIALTTADLIATSGSAHDAPGRPRRRRRNAAARRLRAQLLDRLLDDLRRPSARALDRHAGTLAIAFRPADRTRRRLEPLCRLGEVHLACLRHRWRDGRPSLPLTLHRLELDPLIAVVHAWAIAEFDLAADTGDEPSGAAGQPAARPLQAGDDPVLAALAVTMRHRVLDHRRGELPDVPPAAPEFLFGFQELPEPSPLYFESSAVVLELAVDSRCDIDELWLALQGRVLVEPNGRLTELPRGQRPPEAHELPPGVRLFATWPSWLFARDAVVRDDTHPIDGSPRPAGTEPVAMPSGWFLRDGVPLPCAQQPDLVLVRPPAAGAGRLVRNPAWSVLGQFGRIDRRLPPDEFRRHAQPDWPAWQEAFAGRHPGRWDRIGVEVHHLAQAMGLPGSRPDVQRMLAEPAAPQLAPGLPDVQLCRPRLGDGRRPAWAGPGFHLELADVGHPAPPPDAGHRADDPRRPRPVGGDPAA